MRKKAIRTATNLSKNNLQDKVSPISTGSTLSINFSKFQLNPICINGKFNNHFQNAEQYQGLISEFLGKILPKITSETYTELQREANQMHFHIIDDAHQVLVWEILREYGFSDFSINQMYEDKNLCEFSATFGHVIPARAICHKVGNVLFLLFLDVNHHIYINRKYTGESLLFESCPSYLDGTCNYMPESCFAVDYLDEEKLERSFGYNFKP